MTRTKQCLDIGRDIHDKREVKNRDGEKMLQEEGDERSGEG